MIERAVATPATRAVPRHVAIFLDGDRRWARERGLTALEGYRAGVLALRAVVREAGRMGIELLTAHILSEDQHARDPQETQALLELIAQIAYLESASLAEENVRVRIIGRTDRLPAETCAALTALSEATQACTGLTLTLAVDYGARTEIHDAVRALTRDVAQGKLKAADVNEQTLAAYLYTTGVPDPDLVIRTGGELRLSNFLLYQAAYSELWATPRYWPDFDASLLHQAVADFTKRQRRFGS